MKITIEFDNWEEMEVFRSSGKKTRGKAKDEEQVEDVAQAITNAQPLQQPPSPPPTATVHNFPGGNSGSTQVHPLVTAILARIDGAVSSGQSTDAVITWFRQQIGPDAANATLEQIKQIFIPRMSKAQLEQIAPLLGISP
jgi:hypothetical protein